MPGLSATVRRQILESQITPGQLLQELMLRKAVRLPAKRYRVENDEAGKGGNSYLLTLEDAQETVRRHGGKIAELVSAQAFYRATAKFLSNACELCDQPKGEPCLENPKIATSVREPHPIRLGKSTRADRAALKLPECPACKAKEGRPCRTERGRKQMPHRKRLPPKPKKVRIPVKELAACEKCRAPAGEACHGKAGGKVKTHAGRERAQETT